MRKNKLSSVWLGFALMALTLSNCVHTQRATQFLGPASLALDVLARELVALGLTPAELDEPSGTASTRWQDLSFMYGMTEDERETTLFRSYLVVLQRGPADTTVTLRARMKVCAVGTRVAANNRLPADCQDLPGLLEQHQQELDKLGMDLKVALRKLRPSGFDDIKRGPGPVLVVFDLQAPLGLLPKGEAARLTDFLAAKLTETGRFRVVPRETLRAKLAAGQKQSYAERYGPEYQIDLGRAMAANKLLTTQLIGAGDACTLAATLYDMKSETAEAATSVQSGCGADQLPKGLTQLARKLSDHLP